MFRLCFSCSCLLKSVIMVTSLAISKGKEEKEKNEIENKERKKERKK